MTNKKIKTASIIDINNIVRTVVRRAFSENTYLGPGRLAHGVGVGGVEAEGRSWGAVGDEVHPEEVEGSQGLRQAEERREENSGNLADIARDQEADEGLDCVCVKKKKWNFGFEGRGMKERGTR